MAAAQLSDVSDALSLIYGARLTTQINSVAVLPFLLPTLPGDGKALFWTAEFSGAADASASTEGAAYSSSDADDEAEEDATLGWAIYDKIASVTDLAEAAVASNFNPGSVGVLGTSLLMGRVRGQVRRVGLGIAADMYGGNPAASPTELAGAALAIDSSGTFAGIAPTTFTEWAAAENSIAKANLSFKNIREGLFTPIYDASGETPEFCTCDSATFDLIRDLYSDKESYVREIALGRGGGMDGMEPRIVKLSAGMQAVEVDGIAIVRDRFATADTIYGWNTNYVSVRQLLPSGLQRLLMEGVGAIQDFFRRITDNPNLILPREELEGMAARGSGMRPHIKFLGDRGTSKEAVISVWGQVQWDRRNAFGKLTLT